MNSISVSNLDFYRTWRADEEADMASLLRRLRGEEPQSEQMKAGEALHSALEHCLPGADGSIFEWDKYKFYVRCDGEVALPILKEHRIEKQYGDLLVRGRVDGITGRTITDYKSTGYLDADRLLEGFQWRFYLDMTGCDSFLWKIFTLREFSDPHTYEITKVEELKQYRYEGLAEECARLAADFAEFAKDIDYTKRGITC